MLSIFGRAAITLVIGQQSGFGCFGAVCDIFVYEISQEPLKGFAPNSQGRRVWSLFRMSLDVKVKGQKSKSQGTKKHFFGPFGGMRAVFVL